MYRAIVKLRVFLHVFRRGTNSHTVVKLVLSEKIFYRGVHTLCIQLKSNIELMSKEEHQQSECNVLLVGKFMI
jgi:hypothetical protein